MLFVSVLLRYHALPLRGGFPIFALPAAKPVTHGNVPMFPFRIPVRSVQPLPLFVLECA